MGTVHFNVFSAVIRGTAHNKFHIFHFHFIIFKQ